MIEIINKDNGYAGSRELKNELLAKQVHVVCAAQNGLTHLNVYAELWCGIEKKTVNVVCDAVNGNKETGTLYPFANITLLPKSERSSDWNKFPSVLTENELTNCIKDVFVANNVYIKSEKIYFSLEPSYFEIELVYKIGYYALIDPSYTHQIDPPKLTALF